MDSVSDKYGLSNAIKECSSMDALEEIYKTVHNGETSDYVITTTGGGQRYFSPIYTNVAGYQIADGKVLDTYDEDMSFAKRMRRWNKMGFFPSDIATLDDTSALTKQGKVYSNFTRYLPGVEGKCKITNGYDVTVIPGSEAVMDRNGIQSTLNAI